LDKIKLSIVIPVFNSQNTIKQTVEKSTEVLESYERASDYEIIIVNDGSRDGSDKVCEQLSNNAHVCYINFTKNFGQHHALLCGYKYATGNIIVKIDDDLQILPSEIPKMVEALIEKDADVAFGKYTNKKHSAFRNWGSKLNNAMAKALLNKPKGVSVSSFYIMRDYVVDNIVSYTNPYPYIAGLIFKVTDNIINVDVKHAERSEGKSNYTLPKLIKLWINGFVNFSVKPLRVATFLGIILSLLGFIFLIILIIQRALNNSVQLGWTSIMAAVIFFGGIQLLSMGLLGEYIGRIFLSINKFPQYVIKEKNDGREK
jgi:polyisoprenyl-phosphate glycosyltransferase